MAMARVAARGTDNRRFMGWLGLSRSFQGTAAGPARTPRPDGDRVLVGGRGVGAGRGGGIQGLAGGLVLAEVDGLLLAVGTGGGARSLDLAALVDGQLGVQ